LILKKKAIVVTQLMKELSKYDVEVEVQSEGFVLWFHSKIHFYSALTDPELKGYELVSSVQNFKILDLSVLKKRPKSAFVTIKLFLAS